MPEEIMIIAVVAIVFGSITSIVKAILGHLKSGRETQQLSEAGVSTRDLRNLLVDAVEEATLPLHDRIARLERQLGYEAGSPPQLEAHVGEMLDDLHEEEERPLVRRRRAVR
ncbi:MAG: hypothetical protein AAGI71_06500 [Bacteroidota bacterium]